MTPDTDAIASTVALKKLIKCNLIKEDDDSKIIDIFFDTHQEALNWGRRNIVVEVIY